MKSLSKILSVAFLSLLFACGGNNSEKAASSNDSSHLESTAARTSSDAYIDKADAEAVSDAFHDYVKKESLQVLPNNTGSADARSWLWQHILINPNSTA